MKVISAIFPDSGKIKWAASEFEFKYLGLYLTQTTNHIFIKTSTLPVFWKTKKETILEIMYLLYFHYIFVILKVMEAK